MFPSTDFSSPTPDDCAICMNGFRPHEKTRSLLCGHRLCVRFPSLEGFHRDCIDRWVVGFKSECPLCKRVVWMSEATVLKGTTDNYAFDEDNTSFVCFQ